jgi:hypothetical protein
MPRQNNYSGAFSEIRQAERGQEVQLCFQVVEPNRDQRIEQTIAVHYFLGENSYRGCFGKLIEALGLGAARTPIWLGKIDAPKPWIVIGKFATHFVYSVANRSDT